MSITAHAISKAQPGAVLRDADVRGLHVRVSLTKRTFYLYYRTLTGTERRPKIGDFGILTINDARRIARDMLRQVAEGKDPAGERNAAKHGLTVNELIDIYNEKKLPARKSKRSIKIIANHVRDALGNRKVAEVSLSDIEALHAKVSKTAPIQANRVVAFVSVLLNMAERLKVRPLNTNPCKLVERNAETKRKRYMNPETEAAAIGAALRSRLYGHEHEGALFILLLLLTGARKSELGLARLDQRRGNMLVLDEHKTSGAVGEKVIHLPQAAVDLLDDPLRPQHPRNGFLLGVRDPRKMWDAVREQVGCHDLRLHDLRHTFVSFGVPVVGLDLSGQLVGHASRQTTKRYEHMLTGPAQKAVNAIADSVKAAMEKPAA